MLSPEGSVHPPPRLLVSALTLAFPELPRQGFRSSWLG